mgnify:FL=1
MDKEFKVNNHTDMDLNGLSGEITKFYPYIKEKLGFDKPVVVNLVSDPENGKNIFGTTAQYSPMDMTIDIFVDGRHPKDILRSLSHELVHHTQNCRGDFDKIGSTAHGYAQKDPFLRKLEAEAYLLGNGLLFRDFEDMRKSKMKTNENKFNLKDMIRNMLNETINEYVDTMETIEEDAYEDEPMEEGDEMDVDEAKLPKNWRSLPTDHPSRVAFRKKYRARKAKRSAKKASKRKDRTMNFSDEEGSVITAKPRKGREMKFSDKEGGTIRTPTGTSASSDKMNALLQPYKKDGKTSKPKAVAKSKSKRKPDLADEIGMTSIQPKKFKGIKGLEKKIAGKRPELKSREIKVASPEQMTAFAGKKKAPDSTAVAKPGTGGRKKMNETTNNANVDSRNDEEWYNDSLYESLVKKWTK